MNKENNLPVIRFAGFTDTWEQRELGEVIESVKNGYAYKADGSRTHKYKLTRIETISTGEINTEKLGSSEIINDTYRLLDGDILFSHINSLPYIGNTAIYSANLGEIYHGMNLLNIRANQHLIEPYFLLYLLKKEESRDWFRVVAKPAVNQCSIATADVVKFIFSLPNLKEQTAISTYFRNLDNLITLHQRKLETLKKLKKSMLQKMFPKNGKNVPKIRFKGFTDAWEQRKLGEVTNSYSGGTPSVGNLEYYDGDIPFIRSGEINSSFTELFISEKGLNNSSAKLVNIGYILYALYGATSGEVGISQLKGAINQAILAIQPKENYNAQFIMQWLRKSKGSIVDTYLQGGQGNLSGAIVKGLEIQTPTLAEQTQIGTFFKHLDNLITLHQRKLETLKKLKKSMLQKMFV